MPSVAAYTARSVGAAVARTKGGINMSRLIRLVLFACLVTGGTSMAQSDPQAAEELQKQIDLINKQKDLAKAQKELLDAQNALAAAKTDPSQQVATANAATALANARKAQSDAELAAFKSAVGEVPSSSLTGAVATNAGTGDIEANLLAARAVRDAAANIEPVIKLKVPEKGSVIIMAVSDVPTFQNHIAYKAQFGIVKLALEKAIQSATQAPEPGAKVEAAAPLLGGAGLLLDATTKLLSFFRSDYTVQGVTVDASDLVAVTEIANKLAADGFAVTVPAIFNGKAVTDAGQSLIADITLLSAERQVADNRAKQVDVQIDDLTKAANAEADPTKKQVLLNDASRRKGLADALRGAIGVFDAWFTKLTTADDKGVIGLVTVAKEQAIVDLFASGGKLLAIKVQKTGGAFMTKKNLWTFFGAMPLYHMGGASVSYALMEGKSGQVHVSGVVPVYGGFVKAGEVRAALERK